MATYRILWRSFDLGIKDEPLAKSLWEYRQKDNRIPVGTERDMASASRGRKLWRPNLISSHTTTRGKHLPIIDLDNVVIVKSSTAGHFHMYLTQPVSKLRMYALLFGLYFGGAIELGFLVWSIRRGGTFVRLPSVEKAHDGYEDNYPSYGWFRKLK